MGSSSSTAERFGLVGRSTELDPRTEAWRPDLADIALAGKVFAAHYARPLMRKAAVEAVVHSAPRTDSDEVATLAAAGSFAVLEVTSGWAWGYVEAGHLVGYVPEAVLVTR